MMLAKRNGGWCRESSYSLGRAEGASTPPAANGKACTKRTEGGLQNPRSPRSQKGGMEKGYERTLKKDGGQKTYLNVKTLTRGELADSWGVRKKVEHSGGRGALDQTHKRSYPEQVSIRRGWLTASGHRNSRTKTSFLYRQSRKGQTKMS